MAGLVPATHAVAPQIRVPHRGARRKPTNAKVFASVAHLRALDALNHVDGWTSPAMTLDPPAGHVHGRRRYLVEGALTGILVRAPAHELGAVPEPIARHMVKPHL